MSEKPTEKPVLAAPGDQLFGEHRDAAEIQQEIKAAASDVAETLDALQAKLTPDAVIDEAKHIAVAKISDARDYVFAKAREYPNATTLLALGALWVVGRNLFGQGRGSGVVSLALGASIGVVLYRTLDGSLMPPELAEETTVRRKARAGLNPTTHPAQPALE